MTAVDPPVTRAAPRAVTVRALGRRVAASSVTLGSAAALTLLAWTVVGYGLGAMLDAARSNALTGTTDGLRPVAVVTLWAAIVVGAILVVAVARLAPRRTCPAAASVLALAIAAGGLAAGAVLVRASAETPWLVGLRELPLPGGRAEPWTAVEWLLYWEPVWLPGLLTAVAVGLAIAAGARAGRHARERRLAVTSRQAVRT